MPNACDTCGNDAFRRCEEHGDLCQEHLCDCLRQEPDLGEGWLSTPSVLSEMTSEKLADARSRLSLQLYAIDRELQIRKFDDYREKRPKTDLTELDLIEERSVRRFGGSKQKVTRKAKPVAPITAKDVKSVFDALSPDQLKRIQDAMKKRGL